MSYDGVKRRQPTNIEPAHDQASDLLYAYAHEILKGFQPVDVVPQLASGKEASAQVELRAGTNLSEANPVVFSLHGDRKAPDEKTGLFNLPSLDGYVLTGAPGSWMIGDFSKGGPPNSAPNIVSDFIAAGAASGNAVLFFNEKDPDNPAPAHNYDNIQVVVTTLHGVTLSKDAAGQVWKAVGPVYSIASTAALPANTNPTLLIVTPLRSDIDTARLVNMPRIEYALVLAQRALPAQAVGGC